MARSLAVLYPLSIAAITAGLTGFLLSGFRLGFLWLAAAGAVLLTPVWVLLARVWLIKRKKNKEGKSDGT